MRVLVACEYSGTVRDAFISLGHEAMSCDLLSTDRLGPHYEGDVFDVIDDGWDLMIAHPPCTYLCNSGVSWLGRQDGRWEKMKDGAVFFKKLLDCNIPQIAVENPIMHRYAIEIVGRRQDQIIHPWQFGHYESKSTCLWIKNLPKLHPTNVLTKPVSGRWENQTKSGQNNIPPSADRWKLRSKTYSGIAMAMAKQWGVGNDN